MRRKLASELQQLYRSKGKQHIFINGMNQEQLSIAWYTKMGRFTSGATLLSRIISGERDPTPHELTALCDVLNVSDEIRWNLETAFAQDVTGLDFIASPSDVALARFTTAALRSERVAGRAFSLIERVQDFDVWLADKARSAKYGPVLSEFRVTALFEQGIAYVETAQPEEVFTQTQRIVKAIRPIAKTYGCKEFDGMADHRMGVAYHINNDPPQAVYWLRKAADKLQNAERLLLALRTLAVDLARLNGEEARTELEHIEAKIRRLIQNKQVSAERAAFALEGLARAWGLLGDGKAAGLLQEAAQRASKQEVPARFVQRVRTMLEIGMPVGGDDLHEAFRITKEGRYHRYLTDIERLSGVTPSV